jgi:hypothetical protein
VPAERPNSRELTRTSIMIPTELRLGLQELADRHPSARHQRPGNAMIWRMSDQAPLRLLEGTRAHL